jgi:uncharacterized membrane protein YcaP (DUF421 family)
MKEYEIKLSDIQRILFGEVPLYFFIEVIFRLMIIYLILMVSMRLMGKRMSSQLSRNEMAAVASLAAAVGVPLMNPDRGLLPAVLIAAIIIIYQILIAKRASHNRKFESITQDRLEILIEDGVLNPDVMLHTRVSKERVFAQLRAEQVSHLGMVKRLYFEAGGMFSFLKTTEPKPGLSVLPVWDTDLAADLHSTVEKQVCSYCGNDHSARNNELKGGETKCGKCGNKKWVQAVKEVV